MKYNPLVGEPEAGTGGAGGARLAAGALKSKGGRRAASRLSRKALNRSSDYDDDDDYDDDYDYDNGGGGDGGGGGGGGGGSWLNAGTFKAVAMVVVLAAVGTAIWFVWTTFNTVAGPPAPSAPPNPPGAPLRVMGSPCCVYPNAASNCHDHICEPGGSGYGVGGNGKCGDWDAHNDYHTYGTHGSRYADGEEYRAYLDTEWMEYNTSLSVGNRTEHLIEVNGTYYPWLQGDDWKYVPRISNTVPAQPLPRTRHSLTLCCDPSPLSGTASGAVRPRAADRPLPDFIATTSKSTARAPRPISPERCPLNRATKTNL